MTRIENHMHTFKHLFLFITCVVSSLYAYTSPIHPEDVTSGDPDHSLTLSQELEKRLIGQVFGARMPEPPPPQPDTSASQPSDSQPSDESELKAIVMALAEKVDALSTKINTMNTDSQKTDEGHAQKTEHAIVPENVQVIDTGLYPSDEDSTQGEAALTSMQGQDLTPLSVTENPDLIHDDGLYSMSVVKRYTDAYGNHDTVIQEFDNSPGNDVKDYIKYTLPHMPDYMITRITMNTPPKSQEPIESKSVMKRVTEVGSNTAKNLTQETKESLKHLVQDIKDNVHDFFQGDEDVASQGPISGSAPSS